MPLREWYHDTLIYAKVTHSVDQHDTLRSCFSSSHCRECNITIIYDILSGLYCSTDRHYENFVYINVTLYHCGSGMATPFQKATTDFNREIANREPKPVSNAWFSSVTAHWTQRGSVQYNSSAKLGRLEHRWRHASNRGNVRVKLMCMSSSVSLWGSAEQYMILSWWPK